MYLEKILTQDDVEKVFEFESRRVLSEGSFDDVMKSWSSPWRKESLNHYAGTGWSFFLEREGSKEVCGFLLAQMVVFYRGFTQTLHVEYVGADDLDVRKRLVEVACRWAKDKHLQRVFLPATLLESAGQVPFPAEQETQSMWAVRTTKA